MSIELNHTIVYSHDERESAQFLADLPGLPAPKPLVLTRQYGSGTI